MVIRRAFFHSLCLFGLGLMLPGRMDAAAVQKAGGISGLQMAAAGWYESRNVEQLAEMEKALQEVLPLALKQSPWVINQPGWEEAAQQQAYHDAGSILLAKCCTLLYAGRAEEARPGLMMVDERFPHALLLHPDHTVVQVRKRLHYHEMACVLDAAIKGKHMDVFEFPPERDEFDGYAQRQAVLDLTLEHLRAGDYEVLEAYVSQARLRHLKTAAGQWVTSLICDSLHPGPEEEWPDEKWTEVGEVIQGWLKSKPDSPDAQLAIQVHDLTKFTRERPKNRRSVIAKMTEAQKKLEKIGPLNPVVTQLQMSFSLLLEDDFSIAAGYFNEGYDRFPDFMPNLYMMYVHLLKDSEGPSLNMKFLAHLGKSEHAETLALLLCQLPPLIVPITVQGLDPKILSASIHRALELYPHSLSLRNDLGRLATLLKMPDLAREIMLPVGTHWDREKWQGMEEEVTRLTEPKLVNKGRKSEA